MRRLGFVGDEVHEEAERLEHAASDALIERMADALGHPTLDPHGAPIPAARAGTRAAPRKGAR
ncbi:MAG: metal-dependent transcriptional regulator [Gemmatimonadota bacterium]